MGASTSNYDSAMAKYNNLVSQYMGADNYSNLYGQAQEIANKNNKQTQSEKFNAYVNQGMNPTKAAALASKDASTQATQDKNNLVSQLYNANRDVVNAQSQNLQHAQAQDNTRTQNIGRALSVGGGLISGVASAL